MKHYYLIIGFLLMCVSCKPQSEINKVSVEKSTIEDLIQNLEDSQNKEIIVCGISSLWGNAYQFHHL